MSRERLIPLPKLEVLDEVNKNAGDIGNISRRKIRWGSDEFIFYQCEKINSGNLFELVYILSYAKAHLTHEVMIKTYEERYGKDIGISGVIKNLGADYAAKIRSKHIERTDKIMDSFFEPLIVQYALMNVFETSNK